MKNEKCIVCKSLMSDDSGTGFKNSVTSDNRFVLKDLFYEYCFKCGRIQIKGGGDFNFKEYYSNDYLFLLDNEQVEPEIDGISYSNHVVDFFSEYIKNEQDVSFLDIGAGKGNLLQAFYERYDSIKYFAVEPSASFKMLKKKGFIKKAYNNFFNPDIFEHQKFDYVTLIEVLEHVSDPVEFLQSIKEILSSLSYLLIEVPNFEKHKADILTIDHISLFTPSNIENLFMNCGFEIVKRNIGEKVPMQFILKINNNISIMPFKYEDPQNLLCDAGNYVKNVINDVNLVYGKDIVVYGQNIIIDFLVGNKNVEVGNIKCIINDTTSYQGKKRWRNIIDVVGFSDFKEKFDVEDILLSMNGCYHSRILPKLKGYNVLGLDN